MSDSEGGEKMSDCKYILEKNKEPMFDFFALLGAIQSAETYADICPRQEFKQNDKVSDAYYRLFTANKRLSDGLRMFFVYKPERHMNFFDWLFRSEIDSYVSSEDLIRAIDQIEPNKIVYQAMKFNDPYNNFQDKFYEDIINSRDLFMSYMNGLNASTEIRWEIMSFMQHPEEVVKLLKEYVEKMYREFSLEYADFTTQRATLNTTLANCISDGSMDAAVIENEISEKEAESKIEILSQHIAPPTKEVKVVGLLFAPNMIYKVNAARNLYYVIGTGYMEYYTNFLGGNSNEEKLGELFKAFTDTTRAQIIEILHEKECYNGELSRLLDVPMSSLTHHMEILNNCGFVIKRNVGKRTYYKLNKKQFLNASRMLRKYVDDYEN